jgi:hypothetical protein
VPISPNILSTIVLCIAFVCQLLLESTDPSLTGWGRLIVRAIQMADMVVLMQIRGIELPLPPLPPFMAKTPLQAFKR